MTKFIWPLLLCPFFLSAQYQFQRLNHLDQIRQNADLYNTDVDFHTSIAPFNRTEIHQTLGYDNTPDLKFGYQQWFWRKLFDESLVKLQGDNYELRIDPVINLRYGYDLTDKSIPYTSTRGVTLEGKLGKNFSFTSTFLENQARFPVYVADFAKTYNVVPGQGFARDFGGDALDFSMASGEISYSPNDIFSFSLGQGRNFFGEGYRSLILSDVGFNYPYFKIQTSFWKIKYTNLWAQLYDVRDEVTDNGIFSKKYLSSHYLSLNINSRWNVSLFESIVLGDTNQQRGIDPAFFNPVILYRPVEFAVGSGSGNALLGMGTSYKLTNGLMVYGQALLDEFTFAEFFGNRGYWGNKFSYQAGIKYYHAFGVKGLFARLEYNSARPYTYSHQVPLINYGHYGQPLGHPWGANFGETLTRWYYYKGRWEFEAALHYGQIGLDTAGSNWGSDIYKSYDSREQDYDNATGQGVKANLVYVLLRAAWLVNPESGLKLETGVQLRSLSAKGVTDISTQSLPLGDSKFIFFGLRTELFNRYFDF
ncbi:MAG: gliding motility protein RemB [Owenweeksia sp.]|nr:gliding motility protein RemB [Owenweeksia sp.]MBG00305.1 gliding motility protein RemB [Owenweeksia sp.]HBF20163.1 gliding motility protein RemB [Cryomorphaceae bacterium]|tara:strand:- start:2399 stop:4000 length:1602 start_codon:yes stop_codon:yes gene_type:complete